MRATWLVMLVAAAAVLAASCEFDPYEGTPTATQPDATTGASPKVDYRWPIWRGGPRMRGVAEGTLPDALKLEWRTKLGGAIISSPVVADGRAYIGSTNGKVYALDLMDGSKVWEFDAGNSVEAPPVWAEGRIFVGTTYGDFYALDAATGEPLWKAESNDQIIGSAAYFPAEGDRPAAVCFGSHDFTLYCLAADDGHELWTFEADNYINSSVGRLDDAAFFGGCDAVVRVVNVADGRESEVADMGSYIAATPAIVDGVVYVGTMEDPIFSAVELATNKVLWDFDVPADSQESGFYSSPAVSDDCVVVGCRDYFVHCRARADGRELWTFETGDEVDSSPVIAGGRVCVGGLDGFLYILDLKTGELVTKYEIGAGISSSPAVIGGHILIGAGDGYLYAFGPSRKPEAGKGE